ncbi:MAG: hypothetical protein L6Q59_16505 [Ignavibacteriaceae bacterium]|nr:hypothetical protein [Ignavibacteriaceae bacterium]
MSRNLKKEQTEAEPNGDHLSDDNILKSQFFYAIYLFVLSGILIGISTGFGNILYSLGSMFSAMLVLAFIPGVIWFVGELRNRRDRSK